MNAVETQTTGIFIVNAVTHEPDSCTFNLHAPDIVPVSGQEVVCYLDSTAGTVLFAGVIVSTTQYKLAPNVESTDRLYTYQVECQDYSKLLNQRLVIETYVSKKSDYIIADIVSQFTDAAFSFTTNNVERSRTITRVLFNYIPVAEALQQLADLLEWDWYIDSDKDIHFFEKETRSAPFVIDDTAVTTKINNFQVTPDYTQVRNRVYVRGGAEVSASSIPQAIEADGEARFWALSYDQTSSLSMKIDSVPQTVGVEYLNDDDGTYDFLWNSNEKYVRAGDFAPTATPTAGAVIEFTYNFKMPVIVRADNIASQVSIAAIEGGDGIYEDIIWDDSIDSKSVAQDRAIAEVNQFGNFLINGGFTTYESGFVAGQFVEIDVPNYEAYSGKYQIQRISITADGPNDELYMITFASTLYELKDFLLALVRGASRLKLAEDEMIDILKVLSESITVTDTLDSTELNAHPVKWGNPTTGIWNMFTWG